MSLFSWYLTKTKESQHAFFATYNNLESRIPKVSKSKKPNPRKNPHKFKQKPKNKTTDKTQTAQLTFHLLDKFPVFTCTG